MQWYSWLTAPYRSLIAQYQQNRGHHALLLHAEQGLGAEQLVMATGRWLLCQRKQGERICRECHSCQLMQAGTHPDWHVLAVEEGKSQLSVEQIRELTGRLTTHSHQGGAKVIWICAAESLSVAAANALLKTLEEPPGHTYFILSCQQPAQLPATLRSRCLYTHLPVPSEEYAAQWLAQQVNAQHVQCLTALRLCGGAPLAALKLMQEPGKSTREALCTTLQNALNRQEWLLLLPQLQQGAVADNLHWLAALFLDAAKWHAHAQSSISHQDVLPLVAQLAACGPMALWQRMAQECWHCRQQLLTTTGLNSELMLADCLCRWQKYLLPAVTY
ncbi:MAG: DNA polymerase III subunit delta' [Enterobacteriaceae bacterium]